MKTSNLIISLFAALAVLYLLNFRLKKPRGGGGGGGDWTIYGSNSCGWTRKQFEYMESNDIPYNYKQLWDCFSENVCVIEYDFLAYHRGQVVLRDGTKVWGTYILTVDWYNNPYSDEPSDYKCGHLLESDDGYLLCMPNNRIFWKDSNWVTKQLPEDLKQYKVDTNLDSVENQSDRWIVEDTDSFYYDIKDNGE